MPPFDPSRSEPESVTDIFVSLGLTGAPDATVEPAAPLTRRELRERERAAASAAPIVPRTPAAVPDLSSVIASLDAMAVDAASSQAQSDALPANASNVSVTDASEPDVAAPARRARRAPESAGLARRRSAPRSDRRRAAASGRRSAGATMRTVGSRLLSVGALLFAGALAVGMSVPANAFYSASSADAEPNSADVASASIASDTQTVDVAAGVAAADTARDGYTVTSWSDMVKLKYGTRNFSYAVNGTGAIRWPFPYEVPISSGYGERNAPCRGCSSLHMGIDFVPGSGAPIYAIMDGTVEVHEQGGAFGNHVEIVSEMAGKKVEFIYAHMIYGSSALQVGDEIKVGDLIGLVGQSGAATGPHLHLEVIVDGQHVDPFTFLKTYASP